MVVIQQESPGFRTAQHRLHVLPVPVWVLSGSWLPPTDMQESFISAVSVDKLYTR